MSLVKHKFRIGLLHYSCPPVVGGVEEIVHQHAHVLDRLGQEVSILAGMGEPYSDRFPVRIEPLVGSAAPQVQEANDASRGGDHRKTEELRRRIRGILADWSEDLDVILAHNVLQMPFNLALVLALWDLADADDGARLISWAHDSPFFSPDPPGYLREGPWRLLRTRNPRIQYVTISNSRRQLFETHLGDFDWVVVPNGIDPAGFFYLDPRTSHLAEDLRLFRRDLVVVQPARVVPRKNQELALEIVHGLKQLGHDVLFILTGAYDPHSPKAVEYYRRLQDKVAVLDLWDNVAILAEYRFADGTPFRLDNVVMRDLYLVADLLLMTSLDEGFGLPLLEAGMIKLPIACTDIATFREVGEGVCFIRPQDPPLFSAGRIMEYLARTGPHQMYRNVMRNYIWDRICREELLPLLEKVTEENRRTESE